MLHSQKEQDLEIILAQLNSAIERQISDFDRFSMLPYYLPDIFSFLNKPSVSREQWGTAEINAQKTMVRLMSAYPSINSSVQGLMVYGMNGTFNGYRMSGDSSINLEKNMKDDNWYKEVLAEQGGFVITGVNEIKQFKGTPIKAIIGSRLLMDDDYQPFAVIAMLISPDFIPNIVRSLQFNEVQVTVFDRESNLIYTSAEKLAEQLRSMGSNEKKGAWQADVSNDANGKRFSGNFLKSDYLQWKIYIGVNRDEMLKGNRSIRNFTLAIVIILVIIAVVVSILLSRGLSKPISRLIRSMRNVENGNFSIPSSFGRQDEIGQLERSYGKMVHRLDDLIHSIEEKERQKRLAELYALRARIQPHFLYNTLNSIRMLAILQQSSQIAKLLQALSKLLHANMKLDSELVSLEDEIRLLKDYASLMDLRYTNVFEIDWQIPLQIYDAVVPTMLLQPLVENAIFHGANGLERKLHIVVQARLEEEESTLVIEIRDDGTGLPNGMHELLKDTNSDTDSNHIGLNNVRDRIRLRFGNQYGLTFEQNGGFTKFILKLPYKMIGKETGSNVESDGG
jgi:two-component system sensor histidine kinase YesM